MWEGRVAYATESKTPEDWWQKTQEDRTQGDKQLKFPSQSPAEW